MKDRRDLLLYTAILFLILLGTIFFYFLYVKPVSQGVKVSLTPLPLANFSIVNGPKDVSQPTAALINSKESWDNFQRRLVVSSTQVKFPEVDFSRQSVLVVFAGNREKGGNQLEIKKVNLKNGKIIVKALLTIPGENCLNTPFYTSPVAMGIIAKTEAEVVLDLEEKERPCSAEKRLHVPLPLWDRLKELVKQNYSTKAKILF